MALKKGGPVSVPTLPVSNVPLAKTTMMSLHPLLVRSTLVVCRLSISCMSSGSDDSVVGRASILKGNQTQERMISFMVTDSIKWSCKKSGRRELPNFTLLHVQSL